MQSERCELSGLGPHACRVAAMLFLIFQSASAADWPQLLGPKRNGEAPASPALAATWPKEGPRTVWRTKIGQGFAGPVVAGGRLVIFHREGMNEVVEARDSRTGTNLWRFEYPTAYSDDHGFDEGPRGTPTLHDDRVYSFGADGALHCVRIDSGRKVWAVDTRKEFGARKGFFGLACSPLVEGDLVVVQVGGGDGAGVVAFDRSSGARRWKATDHEAGYSSPTAATIQGKRYGLCFTRNGLVALDPPTGRVLFEFPWRAQMHASVNASVPLVMDNLILLSTSYNAGAVVLRVQDQRPEKVWSGDDILSTHYMTAVHRDGFLYGIDGRADSGFRPAPVLRCVEFKSGKVRWSKEGLTAGTLVLAGDSLLLLTGDGELIRFAVDSNAYRETARAQILSRDVRAHPALADGFLYARSKTELICVNLGKE